MKLRFVKIKELSRLDSILSKVYSQAKEKAVNEQTSVLKAMQRGWMKGRNECYKEEDMLTCVKDSYGRRIAELQVNYHLVDNTGPVHFACDGDVRNEVVVTFFLQSHPH